VTVNPSQCAASADSGNVASSVRFAAVTASRPNHCSGVAIRLSPRRWSENATEPGAGQNHKPSHHRSISGVVWAFHHSSVVLRSGSPRSCGIAEERCHTSGYVMTQASVV
jgi:hypothetical protein